ncbi:Lipin/Ned1/Smp2-domain-containing protein [Absidia repens]|uniref:phosphatidate phosphatase n=1 Tax=Absidia repens TaxID=90262 RepID=A0A1X2II72_9FUNG|nr:Lipin/Ned1/Smp2-domain-containing protein [Absidia repens]
MEYFGKLFSSVHTFYNELNPATLSGAIDIIVVEHPDGKFSCSPFHVRFGKLSVLRPQEKKVIIKVNDEIVPYVMKVGEAGEAFFIFETDHDVPEEYQTSPLLDASPNDTKTPEDPPFLDIGQAKIKNQSSQGTGSSLANLSDFDDDEITANKSTLEPQSPKIIIEEQMDKVVTHLDSSYRTTNGMPLNDLNNKLMDMDLHQQPINDTYPQTDGSTVLERTISEPISSTTVTKESFTIRPIDGSLDSIWMAVVRHIDLSDLQQDSEVRPKLQNNYEDNNGINGTTSSNNPTDDDSIFLDISGYKTEDGEIYGKRLNSPPHSTESSKTTTSVHENTNAKTLQGLDLEKGESPKTTSWGWGQSHKGDGDVDQQQDTSTTDKQVEGNAEIRVEPGHVYNIQLSLCGFSAFGSDEDRNSSVFRQHQITFGNFVQNPNILNDKSLVFKHNDRYYAADCSGPFLTSLLVYQKPMAGFSQYCATEGSDGVQSSGSYRFGHGWRQWFSRSSVQEVNPATTTSNTSGDAATPIDGEVEKDDGLQQSQVSVTDENALDHIHNNIHHTTFTTSTKATTFGLERNYNLQEDDGQWKTANESLASDSVIFPKRRNFAKTLRLTSEQLKSLPLKKGVNTISFSVTSSYQGTATCVAKLFLWDSSIKVVISDIDGTITKSDALGHVFTMIGKDWTHNGVAKLYTDIHHNGYQFLYLTSRAIGQADYTRDYLKGVIQNDYQLPDGPVLMSPDRLFTSFHREVIIRKPEMFKMGCLRDVLRLFGDRNPFYAGFGNRITDGVSYRSVDVPTSRIFTIDPHGEIKLELLLGFKSSYVDLNGLVDQMFPPLDNDKATEDQSFNDWNFWKAPLPVIDLPLPDIKSATSSTISPTVDALDNMKTGTLLSSPPTSSSSFTNNRASPKPKPIVPDISSLPKESVIDSPIQSHRKRSILRRLTSRSSLNSSPTSPPLSSTSSSSSLSPSLLPPKMNHNNIFLKNSQSTPTITATTPASPKTEGRPSPVKGLSFELLDDDTFDATLDALEDEIDMDSIPFI